MRVKRAVSLVVIAVLALLSLAGCGGSKSTDATAPAAPGVKSINTSGTVLGIQGPAIERIQKRGKLLVGVKYDVPKFGYKDPETNKVDGYEIDLVRKLAKAILGDDTAYETQLVTPKTRVQMLNNGDIDLVVATMTITEQRKQEVDFSSVYYTDGIGLLVRKDAQIKGLKDLDHKPLGVVKGASTGPKILERAKELGVAPQLVEFDSYPEIKKALLAGTVAGMSTDGAILAGYVDVQASLLPERYSQEPYGIATMKGSSDLAQVIEKVVSGLEKSGDLAKLQDKWGIRVGS